MSALDGQSKAHISREEFLAIFELEAVAAAAHDGHFLRHMHASDSGAEWQMHGPV